MSELIITLLEPIPQLRRFVFAAQSGGFKPMSHQRTKVSEVMTL